MSKHRLGNTQNEYFEIEQPDNAGAIKVTSKELVAKATPVADRTELLARTGTVDGEAVWQSDIGLMYTWDSSKIDADDNGGTIISPDNVFQGCWVASYSGVVNVKWFGFSSSATSIENASSLLKAGTFSKDIIIPSGMYDCDDVIFPTQIRISGSGDAGQCVIRNQSANPLFTFQDKFELNDIFFLPQGVSPVTIKGTTLNLCKVFGCTFDLGSFTGIVGTTLTSSDSRVIELPNCANVDIQFNRFLHGWNDKAYNASTTYEGNNVFRMVNCDSHGQNNVVVSNNYFNDVWTAIYTANINYLHIQNNTILDTADTAIFERCTAGETHTKIITGNQLKNIGKGGIKTLDTNNSTETSFGRNSVVSNNIIENWGMYLTTEAIFAACHYNGGYVYSGTHRAKDLIINGNILLETDTNSCHKPIIATNIDNVNISNNTITLLDGITDIWSFGAWSRFTFSNNIINMQGIPSFYFPLKAIIKGNTFECYSNVNIDNTASSSPEPNRFTILFDGNIIKTVDTTSTRVSYGIRSINNSGGYGNVVCVNNVFETALSYSDSNGVNTPHIANFPTSGNLIDYATIDNNTVIFTDKVATQKIIGGDILYPVYYSGLKGSVKTDEATGVITYKKDADRTTVNTISPTT